MTIYIVTELLSSDKYFQLLRYQKQLKMTEHPLQISMKVCELKLLIHLIMRKMLFIVYNINKQSFIMTFLQGRLGMTMIT